MAFSVAQDTRPPPPGWPAIALPANQDFVFVQLTIGCARIACTPDPGEAVLNQALSSQRPAGYGHLSI
jgi:hypothetical protein